MPKFLDAIAPRINLAKALRASHIRLGKSVHVTGVPAILMGVSCIVLTAGVARALERATPSVPDAFRGVRRLWESAGRGRTSLNP
jgi:hypothetical protein